MDDALTDIIKNYNSAKLDILENQGSCNTTYILSTNKNRYIVKKFNKPIYSNVSKKMEFKLQLLAYRKNISPKPLFLDVKNQTMISLYQEGYHKNSLNKSDLRSIAKTLTKLHKIKLQVETFDIKKYFRDNSKKIDTSSKLALLKIKRFKRDLVLCHNDLNPQNIIFGEKINFIDWEFASLNDRYFDIAAIVTEFKLNKKDENYFLHLYFKYKKPNMEKLETYKIIYKHICKIWFDIILKKG